MFKTSFITIAMFKRVVVQWEKNQIKVHGYWANIKPTKQPDNLPTYTSNKKISQNLALQTAKTSEHKFFFNSAS